MLDAHPRVYAPNTMALGLLCASYDSHNREHDLEGWKAILGEVCRRVNASTHYAGVSVEEQELAKNIPVNDAGSLYLYPYYKGMIQCGAERLITKEHQAWRIAEFFLREFPHSKIVVQVRDPRDHAVSCKKLANLYAAYHGSVPRAARMWAMDQYGALQIREEYGAGIVRIHRYEDLVLHPRETLQGICDFLELEWNESMLDYHHAQAELKKQSNKYLHNMWANLDKPVNASSVGQWKKLLKPYELRAVEREVSPLCSEFGYDAGFPIDSALGDFVCAVYRFCAAVRYTIVTVGIWLAWLFITGDYRVPLHIVFGNAVYAHLPYQRFRDSIGFRF